MPIIVIALVLLLAFGIGGKGDSPRVKQSVNFKVEVDSEGKMSTSAGYGATLEDADGKLKVEVSAK